ncbi:MAG: Wzz/FepE/Etk N-terminal domain-containing protein [candidate division Zixibacteria bacterium]|nr:Wzz/FepE/Etk N-terminal domain-containing protein [candidate division Zixibacteria bacterium]
MHKNRLHQQISSDSHSTFERESITNSSYEAVTERTFEVHLYGFIRMLIRRRKLITTVVGLVAITAVTMMLMTANSYQSKATLLPSGQTDNVTALKDLVGLGSMSMTEENSSALYPLILRSDLVKDALLSKRFEFGFNEKSLAMTVPEYFGETDPTRLRNYLDDITSVNAGKRTGEIVLTVETEYPELSQAVAEEYLNQLEDYNLNKRRSGAKNTQTYLAGQLAIVKKELERAEDNLQTYRLSNSDWAGSSNPEILTGLARHQREVELKSTALIYLQQQYEIAKFTSQKDMPIIRILDKPSLPTIKTGPNRTLTVFVATLFALIGSVALAFALEYLGQQKNGDYRGEYEAIRRDLQKAFPKGEKLVSTVSMTLRGSVAEKQEVTL